MKGDIVLCRASNYGQGRWTDKIISITTKGPFVHVEIDVGDGKFIGAHLDGIGESTASIGPDYVYCSPEATPENIDTAIAWLKTQVGRQYGFLDIVTDGFKFLNMPFIVTQADHYDCSDLATRFLLIAQDKKAIPRLGDAAQEPHTVSPNDLARAFGVIK